jgi:GTP 3',8-cyclase
VTGGEPTVRKEFREIMERLSELPARKIALTTNGAFLQNHLDFLRNTRLSSINISMDSLQEERFNAITKTKRFKTVKDSLFAAREMGFHVKVNCILLKGLNDEEILDFVEFSEKTNIEVRFLEYMRVGPGCNSTLSHFMPADDAIGKLMQHRELTPVDVEKDSTSFVFETDRGGKIGFIASETKAFCGTCSRLRLTAKGGLRACLFSEAGVSLRGLSEQEVIALARRALGLKPPGRLKEIAQSMNEIGG